MRAAREERGISIEDIAASTRIQRGFLEALESGNFSMLPPTYVRAFIRSYAKEVGLDEAEILREYERATGTPGSIAAPETRPVDESKPGGKAEIRASAGRSSQARVLFIVSAVLVVALVLSIYSLREDEPSPSLNEIPFSEVVRQRETTPDSTQHIRTPENVSAGSDVSPFVGPIIQQAKMQRDTASAKAQIASSMMSAAPDSLLLRVMTFDSVWIRVVVDGKVRHEYFAPAHWSGRWKAGDHFLLSLSNTSSATLTLNNMAIRVPAKAGQPVRNFRMNSALLPQRMPQAKPQ